MDKDSKLQNKGMANSRVGTGLLLLLAGGLLLAYKMGAPIPGWLFSWPVILIAVGLLVGLKSKFQNPGAFIMILIGAIFLADRSIPGVDFHNYLIPVLLMGIGLIVIFRPKNHQCTKNDPGMNPGREAWKNNIETNPEHFTAPGKTLYEADHGEYINVQAIFGGIKKGIQSKNFKGGEIISFMGGSEINFMQADIQAPVVLEVNNVFGGTKLIIPSNWDVQNNISAIFGGVEDKRVFNNSVPDSNKKILLKGSCVFGGIEVTNY